MKKLSDKIDELLNEERYREARREPYPKPKHNWFDCLDGTAATEPDTTDGAIPATTVEGKQEEGV